MPIFECQACGLLTQFDKEAQEHNEKDRNHFFKRLYYTWSMRDQKNQTKRIEKERRN